MFVPKIFTAMANKITPKNFLTTNKPFGPKARSIHFSEPNTRKITTQLIRIPTKMFTSSRFAFSDMIVVNVPLPAMSGNAIGTTFPLLPEASGLKNSRPKTISSQDKDHDAAGYGK